MDNEFFKYLIIVIFILGALRSLFKKSPQQQVKKPQQPDPWSSGQESPVVYTPRKVVNAEVDVDDYAIQREIEKMFGKAAAPAPKSISTYPEKQVSPENAAPSSSYFPSTPEVNLKSPEIIVPSTLYPSPEKAYAVSIPAGYDDNTKKEMAGVIPHAPDNKLSGDESSRRFRASVKLKLRNPESLKEYIIISEILGKPKAFE
jgi:hypothetical protein